MSVDAFWLPHVSHVAGIYSEVIYIVSIILQKCYNYELIVKSL